MSAIDNTPENKNFLSPLNFKFQIKKAPHINFFIQKVNIPEVTMRSPVSPNVFVNIPYPGDHLEFGALNITFKVDEDLQNYLEIHNWLLGLGKPDNFEQYANIASNPSWTGEGIYSDISVFVLESTKMPNYEISYVDAFPINLSGITFNSTDNNVNYIEASATFKYTSFKINKI